MADQDYPQLYQQMKDSAQAMSDAAVANKQMMTADENTDVSIPGYGPKPSYSKQILAMTQSVISNAPYSFAGKVYDTPAAGVTQPGGVGEGKFYNARVPGNEDVYIGEYKNVGGVATPVLNSAGQPIIYPTDVFILKKFNQVVDMVNMLLPNNGIFNVAGDNAVEIAGSNKTTAASIDKLGVLNLFGGLNVLDLQVLPINPSSEYCFAWGSKTQTILGIGKAGWIEFFGMYRLQITEGPNILEIVDSNNRMTAGLDKNGTAFSKGVEETPEGDAFLDFVERMHLVIYGQSLSIGAVGVPILNTPVTDALMYNTGVRSYQVTPTSLVDLKESQSGNLGETIASGMVHGFVDKCGGMYGRKLIVNAGGVGGATIQQISKGTPAYTQLLASVTWTAGLMATEGRQYSPDFMLYMQGEANMSIGTPKETYKTLVDTLYSDFNNDTRPVRGSGLELVMLTYQTSSHGYYNGAPGFPPEEIAQGQLEQALTRSHIDMWGPTYMCKKGDSTAPGQANVHHNNHGYRLQGLYAQKVVRHRLRTRSAENPEGEKYLPVHAKSAKKINDTTVLVDVHTYHPPLVIDASQVTELPDGNHGVELHDSTGRLAIASVSIVGGTKIKVVSQTAIGSGAFVAFAWTPDNRGPLDGNNRYPEWFFGRETGVRTTIHDSDPETTDLVNENGANYPLFNYMAIQKLEIA